MPPIVVVTHARVLVKNLATIIEEGTGHILNITPKEEKRIRRPQEVNISLPYFHGKDNVEAYLNWEMKVEQLFACHHISEERKVPLGTFSFQGYALYWWTSLVRE